MNKTCFTSIIKYFDIVNIAVQDEFLILTVHVQGLLVSIFKYSR